MDRDDPSLVGKEPGFGILQYFALLKTMVGSFNRRTSAALKKQVETTFTHSKNASRFQIHNVLFWLDR